MSPSLPRPLPHASSSPSTSSTILLLGGGISSLTTALLLLTSPLTSHHHILLFAQHFPDDPSPPPDYASPWAGGHWRSHASRAPEEAPQREFDARTYAVWRRWILEGDDDGDGDGESEQGGDPNADVDADSSAVEGGGGGARSTKQDRTPPRESVEHRSTRIGLGLIPSQYFWARDTAETSARDGSGLWWRDVVVGFRVLDLGDSSDWDGNPEGDMKEGGGSGSGSLRESRPVFGVQYQTVCINVPQHLSYLYERVKKLGAKMVRCELKAHPGEGLEGLVRQAKSMAVTRGEVQKEGDIEVVINCLGLGSRHFVNDVEASRLYPIKGQTVLVKGEARMARTWVGFEEGGKGIAYVIPRPGSATTILGGTKVVGSWNGNVQGDVTDGILERVSREGLADELMIGKGKEINGNGNGHGHEKGEFEVLSAQVGFRPGRKGGPRVEVERGEGDEKADGKVDGVWIVHNYGHAGAGYQNSIGCAERVVDLVVGLGI